MGLIKVEYSSNNSGGQWWLSDKDWKSLEKAGWKVNWAKNEKPRKDCNHCKGTGKLVKTEECFTSTFKKGTRCFYCLHTKNGRYLGALAKKATIKVKSVKEAIESFENVTGQTATDEGCNCCGPPHSFSWKDGYGSGESLLSEMYPNKKIPSSLREAIENER